MEKQQTAKGKKPLFMFHFVKLIASKFRQWVVFYLLWRHHLQATEAQASWAFFFSCANEVKTCGLVQLPILGIHRDLILQLREFQSLSGDQSYRGLLERASHAFVLYVSHVLVCLT